MLHQVMLPPRYQFYIGEALAQIYILERCLSQNSVANPPTIPLQLTEAKRGNLLSTY